MKLFDKDTETLMDILKTSSPSEVKDYMNDILSDGEATFPNYIDFLLKKKHLKRQDVLIKANLPQKYGYKILTGEAHTSDRDKIIRICLSMEMSLKETQRALKLYGMSELYPKIKRDVLLIFAIGKKIYNIDQVNELLLTENEVPLY